MTPERHQLICDLLYEALELDPEERNSFLNRACSSDTSLRQEIDSLLSSSDDVRANFMQSSAIRLELEPGAKIGEYQVQSLLGSGGMGQVYRARDRLLGRDVAIKVLPAYLTSDPARRWRFEREARAAAALHHPNILAIYQMGTHGGAPYLVSELLEGETLRERINDQPIDPATVVVLAVQIANGLAAAHAKGIVHRDLKPENLFVTTDGVAKILDFGLAKLNRLSSRLPSASQSSRRLPDPATELGVVMGTVGYMAPEQARGQPADTRSDIFAFGAVLYEMVTGAKAFQRETGADTINAILNEKPARITKVAPKSSQALQRLIDRCLEKQPERRFQSASDLARELEALPARSHQSWVKIAALAVVALVLTTAVVRREALIRSAHSLIRSSTTPAAKSVAVERNLTANPEDDPVLAAAISRDGKYVAYTDSAKSVHLLLIDSGDVRELSLSSAYEPEDWFPDGVHLLVKAKRSESAILRFSTFDSSLRKLLDRAVTETAVSPDGSSVAFLSQDRHEVWLMGARGEEPHRILQSVPDDSFWGLAWSPGGQHLAFVRMRGNFAKHETAIVTCDLMGNHPAVMLSDPRLLGRDGFRGLVWLADGRVIYSISAKLDEYNLWAVRTDSEGLSQVGQPEQLTDWKDFSPFAFQATSDGRRLIALKVHTEDGIYVGALTPDTSLAAKRLTMDGWRNIPTAWTDDSKAILFQSKRNGRWTVCRRDLRSKSPEVLVAGPENYRDPEISTNGTLFYTAFASADDYEAANWRLMATPLTGGPRTVLLTGRYSYGCGSSNSARCVVAEQNDHKLLFSWLDPSRGKGEEVGIINDYRSQVAHWSLSPDGFRIAVADAAKDDGPIRILNLTDHKITDLRIQNSKWQYVTGVGWAADGKRLYAILFSESSVVLVSVDQRGNIKVLQEIDPEQSHLGSPLASPDGRYLAFTKRTNVSDLVMLENF